MNDLSVHASPDLAFPFGADDSIRSVLDKIDKQRNRRQSNKVLHGHPSPMFWNEREPPMAEIFAARRRADETFSKRINLYVATPYCIKTLPERCGFCLFPSEDFRGQEQLRTYLRYLAKEADLLRPHTERDRVATLYFGGGTSNLYRPEDYATLVATARSLYDVSPDAELTLEGIPQLFTKEKLAAMKATGITRISIGAQQLDDEMIKLSGRRQTARQVFDTLAWCRELGLEASVDLIFGWPGQTVDKMLADLRALIAADLRHLTHYELNVAGRSDFAKNHRDTLPSIDDNLVLYHESRKLLQAHGYRQVTAYDWERSSASDARVGKYLYEENMRQMFFVDQGRPGRNEMHGLGFAGVTVTLDTPEHPGWSLLNATRVDDYFAALDRDRLPVDRAYHHAVEDLRLVHLFQCLQAGRVERATYRRIFGLDVIDELGAEWRALEQLGWAQLGDDEIRLVGDGMFFTPLIQTILAGKRVEAIRSEVARSTPTSPRLVQLRTAPRSSGLA